MPQKTEPQRDSRIATEYVALAKLKRWKRNPKGHDLELIEASMRRWGYTAPCIVNEATGTLVAGHGRLETLERMRDAGEPAPAHIVVDGDDWLVPVTRGISFASDEEAEAYGVADNQLTIRGGWDNPMLLAVLETARGTEAGLRGTGFSDDDVISLAQMLSGEKTTEKPPRKTEAEQDVVPDANEKAQARPGDVWLLGKHRLMCGDSTKAEDVQRLMNGARAVLMATDPPYLVDYDGEEWDDPTTEANNGLWERAFKVAREHAITDSAAWFVWYASRMHSELEKAIVAAGAFVHLQIIWAKDQPVMGRSDFAWQHEPCLMGWVRPNRPKHGPDWKYQGTVWEFPRPRRKDDSHHPTSKPVGLFAIPIRQYMAQDEVCYEPFSGSGSQIIAAEDLDVRCCAMELSPAYCDVAIIRWMRKTGQVATREGDGRAFRLPSDE